MSLTKREQISQKQQQMSKTYFQKLKSIFFGQAQSSMGNYDENTQIKLKMKEKTRSRQDDKTNVYEQAFKLDMLREFKKEQERKELE